MSKQKGYAEITAERIAKITDKYGCGSASSLVACYRTGHKYVGFEIDEYYYKQAKKRLDKEQSQINIFNMGYNPYQE